MKINYSRYRRHTTVYYIILFIFHNKSKYVFEKFGLKVNLKVPKIRYVYIDKMILMSSDEQGWANEQLFLIR